MDIAQRQSAIEQCGDTISRNTIGVRASRDETETMAARAPLHTPSPDDTPPVLRVAVSDAVASICAGSQERRAVAAARIPQTRKLRLAVPQSIRALYDTVRTNTETRDAALAEAENQSLFSILTATVEDGVQAMTLLLPSIAIRWSVFEPHTAAVTARTVIQGLRDFLDTLRRMLRRHQAMAAGGPDHGVVA